MLAVVAQPTIIRLSALARSSPFRNAAPAQPPAWGQGGAHTTICLTNSNCLATAGCGLHPERAQPVVVQGHGMTRGDDRARW